MNINIYRSVILAALALLATMLVMPTALSDEMTSSMMFDETSYTAEVEKGHQKLHMLYGKVVNKSLPAIERKKARREYFKVSQDLNKRMHARVMAIDMKKGGALSHTDILLSTHLLLMTQDMLSTLQQEAWAEDNRLSN